MVQIGFVFLQNHGWKDTKICEYCCRSAHKDHVGMWGPGNQLQDLWFCRHECVQCAMVYGVPEQSIKALAERPAIVPEKEHPRALQKLAKLAKRKEGKQPVPKKTDAKQPQPVKVDIAPSKEKFRWADDE